MTRAGSTKPHTATNTCISVSTRTTTTRLTKPASGPWREWRPWSANWDRTPVCWISAQATAGRARYLFHHYGCHVACLNLSDVQNARNRAFNASGKCSLAINVGRSSKTFPSRTRASTWCGRRTPSCTATAGGQVFAESRPGPGQRRTVHLHRPHARRALPRRSPATHPRPRQPRLPGIPSGIPGHAVRAGLSGA